MKRLALALILLVSGCSILPNGDDEPRNPKSQCDEYASRAVQTDDLDQAKNLAARAAECYAAAQNR